MKITARALVFGAAATIAVGHESTQAGGLRPPEPPHAVAEDSLAWGRALTRTSQTQGTASPAQEVRKRREVTPEERAKIEAAIPAKAPAVPKKPRRLLVFDLNVGYGGHASIPYANLAMQLMGEKTGSFAATISSDPAVLEAASLRQFDAVYLNNTVGDIFPTPALRDAFAAFVANGGGLVGNHGASVASTTWSEFGEILGARGASHRMPDEKALINVEDPTHPITRAFDGKPFEYVDEFYRLAAPYSRDKVRVLLSIDPIATDMMQGRCFGQCLRDDNDYPVAWIRQYGKGRVFYTSVGHSPPVFWDPRMLDMFLAGVQYALGDLQADATPRPRDTGGFDNALTAMAQYDWGQDRAAVRRFEREVALVAATKDGAAEAEKKMLKILQSKAPLGAKDVICRQLAIFGSSRSIPVLQEMLRHKDTEAMARYALHGLQAK
jgi:type 1 glutamine amidotransferase